MLTPEEERFHHLATSISRFHSALETLRTIKTALPENPLISLAFRFALVEYASPFTRSDGQLKRYTLDDKYVPAEYLNLHTRIITARHTVHAHSDLTIMNAQFKEIGTQANPELEIRGTYVDELKELQNIDQIITLLNELIHNMYLDLDAQLKALLPPR
jgi:hypothetical protein